jgi:phosphatidylinositol alpha-1,6-mannosyltransferase
MKRLFVTCEYPPIAGGQGSYLKSLWSDLDPKENLLLVPLSCRETQPSARSAGVQTHFAYMLVSTSERWLPRFARILSVLFSMVGCCIMFRPDEIHAGQLIAGGTCALLVRLVLGIPYCVYCHGADLLEFSRFSLARPIIRSIFANSKCIITNSTYTAGRIRERYAPSVPIAIISPCVDERFFAYDTAVLDNLCRRYHVEGRKILLTVARLVERKGHDVVIRSLPILLAKHPDIHYMIAGDGPYRRVLEALVNQCGVNGAVTFCGSIAPNELPSLYHCASAFVMVPRAIESKGDVEGFGIVYIEANASGLPVVASRSGGVPDAVEHGTNGLLVNDPTDVNEVAAVLDKMLSDEDLRLKLAGNAVAWARKFSREAQRKIWQEAIG